MNAKIVLTAAAALAMPAAVHMNLRAQQGPRSVVDAVYSEQQSERGRRLYAESCGACHGEALTGADTAPPLVGPDFVANWKDMTMADLADRIRTSMPEDNPGRLTRGQVADILAYILKVGKYPAGNTDLGSGSEALRAIRIEPPRS